MAKNQQHKRTNTDPQTVIKVLSLNGILPQDERKEIMEAVLQELPESTLQRLHDLYLNDQLKTLKTKIQN